MRTRSVNVNVPPYLHSWVRTVNTAVIHSDTIGMPSMVRVTLYLPEYVRLSEYMYVCRVFSHRAPEMSLKQRTFSLRT